MPPKAKGKKGGARKMPPPLPQGEVLTDGVRKQQWVIGASIGTGGFGEIYTATLNGQDLARAEHVIKIEPHENGPLFSELSYYRRVAKGETIDRWVASKGLRYLPVPKFITAGDHEVDGMKYRFMVMQRFSTDIEKHFRASKRFCEDTVSYLALKLLEALEFLHESEYVHADIKGSNLLTGRGQEAHRVYLVDYGLAFRFNIEGVHKEYKEDPRRAHDGTIEFTSIDAHNGVCPSRRGDLEILGYCLLQWGCGKLPWEDNLTDKNYVASRKKGYRGNAAKLVRDCLGSGGSRALQGYIAEVYKLGYADTPPYSKLKKFFEDQLGGRDPRKTLEWTAKAAKRVAAEGAPVPPKHRKHSPSHPPLPKKMPAKAREQPSSEGSDQVDVGGAKAERRRAAKKAEAERPPPISCLQGVDGVGGRKATAPAKKARLAADNPQDQGTEIPPPILCLQGMGGRAAAPAKKNAPERRKARLAADNPQDQATVGGKRANGGQRKVETKLPTADLLPEVTYPPELGYVSHKGKDKMGGGGGKGKKPMSRDAQRKGERSPALKKGTVKQREEVSDSRRSARNRGKTINYADLSSSFNDSRNSLGASLSYTTETSDGEVSDEEDVGKGKSQVGDKRAKVTTTTTKRKRRRT